MILQALNSYYERLASDRATGIAPFGFSEQKIAFAVVLSPDGSLDHFADLRIIDGSRAVNRPLVVPGQAKSSGSGINPGFLWDNTGYMLGSKPDDPKPERTRKSFEAFREKHLALRQRIACAEFDAVCRFLETWEPERAAEYPILAEFKTGFGVFQIASETHYVHEHPAVLRFWQEELNETPGDGQEDVMCLITGRTGRIALTHEPAIKGVRDAQSGGAKLVSFNCDAFTSYGKEQSLNAPVSEQAAFQYATALNHLLRAGSRQRATIGDTTTVFWSEKATPAEDIFAYLLDPTLDSSDGARSEIDDRLYTLLSQIAHGGKPTELGDPGTRFYILGLSPNAARLAVRFWYVAILGELLENVGRHFADLEIVRGPKDPPFPAIWQLLRETARESKDIAPLLGGAVARAILTGAAYPQALPLAVINRIRADHRINATRAGILKAFLIRNHNHSIAMALDPQKPHPAYRLGRLFATLEKTQEDALPGINATIRERFYSSASATPGAVFPRILRTYQHHLAKLDGGRKVNRERLVQDILNPIEEFPRHLNLEGQAQFALGYYHQRQDFFTSKAKPQSDDNNPPPQP
ncbi:MAG: type I-C CRISPR-associated protein Cas8c/Csd1 [Chthoniobacterales bacterium]